MSAVGQQQANKSAVTLKGSAKLVSEFFQYGIHSILYQRGIYPPESFERKQEYGLTLLVSTDDKVNSFLKDVLAQIQEWLEERKVSRLVLILTSVDTQETLERWEFNVEYEKEQGKDKKEQFVSESTAKDEKKIKLEIRDVIRQITASVTFLPLLDCLCSFDILIYTHKDLSVPATFGESDAKLIKGSEEVRLKSFSTGIHKVETAVTYKSDL